MLQQLRVIAMTGKSQRQRKLGDNPPWTRRHHQHPLAQQQRLFDIVGHQQAGIPLLLPEGDQLPLHTDAGQRIEFAQRLVEQQQTRFVQQGARQRRTLCHPPGQLPRPRLAEGLQPDAVNQRVCLRLQPLFALRLRAQQHVLPHRQPRIERRILKHQNSLRPRGAERRAVDLHLSALRRFQPRQQPQQG